MVRSGLLVGLLVLPSKPVPIPKIHTWLLLPTFFYQPDILCVSVGTRPGDVKRPRLSKDCCTLFSKKISLFKWHLYSEIRRIYRFSQRIDLYSKVRNSSLDDASWCWRAYLTRSSHPTHMVPRTLYPYEMLFEYMLPDWVVTSFRFTYLHYS